MLTVKAFLFLVQTVAKLLGLVSGLLGNTPLLTACNYPPETETGLVACTQVSGPACAVRPSDWVVCCLSWCQCPCLSLHMWGPQSWDIYFTQVTSGAPLGAAYQAPPTLSPTPPAGTLAPGQGDTAKEISDHLLVNSLIRSYQVRQLGGGRYGVHGNAEARAVVLVVVQGPSSVHPAADPSWPLVQRLQWLVVWLLVAHCQGLLRRQCLVTCRSDRGSRAGAAGALPPPPPPPGCACIPCIPLLYWCQWLVQFTLNLPRQLAGCAAPQCQVWGSWVGGRCSVAAWPAVLLCAGVRTRGAGGWGCVISEL